VVDVSRRKAELSQTKAERDEKLTIIGELEDRESELRTRILELEKHAADLAQRLRMRDRDYADLSDQLESARGSEALLSNMPDIDQLYADLTAERERASFFESQARHLLARLESAESDSTAAAHAVAELREALNQRNEESDKSNLALTEAEARIAGAENRLNALLRETEQSFSDEDDRHAQLLAEKLSLEEEMEHLREKVREVEISVLDEWEQERVDQSHLREQLNDIASEVSRLVYAVDGDAAPTEIESLFDTVRKFAGDDFDTAKVAEPAGNGSARRGSLSDRMAALKEIQARN